MKKNDDNGSCYIEVIYQMLVNSDVSVSRSDLFFLLKCFCISNINNQIGYNYNEKFNETSFISKLCNNMDEIKQYLINKKYGLLCFVNTKLLSYNDIYINGEEKIHCIRLLDYIDNNKIEIVDEHIRINDIMIQRQSEIISNDIIFDKDTEIFAVNIPLLVKIIKEDKVNYLESVHEFLHKSDAGINIVINYLYDKIRRVNTLHDLELLPEIKEIYYNLKINSLIFVNKNISSRYCEIYFLSESEFYQQYIYDIENKMQRMVYFAAKCQKEKIIDSLEEIINICISERKL